MPESLRIDSEDPVGSRARVRVKICGLTSTEDSLQAIEAGADALGFNFYPPSKRALSPADAFPWIAELPDGPSRVAVVVNPDARLLRQILEAGIFDLVQFHGDETPSDCAASSLPWIKALPATGAMNETAASHLTPWILFDAVAGAGEYGGTGEVADWKAVAASRLALPEKKIFLAGGLNPENVQEAVEVVRPFAVDVAGGVESAPGKKDEVRMRDFIRAAQTVTLAPNP